MSLVWLVMRKQAAGDLPASLNTQLYSPQRQRRDLTAEERLSSGGKIAGCLESSRVTLHRFQK